MAAARSGDAQAWRALHDALAPGVLAYCLAFCRGDRAAAEDLCQETLTAAFQALPALRDDEAVVGWVRAIARRRCLAWLERRRRDTALTAALQEEPRPGGGREVDAQRLATLVLDGCPDPLLGEAARLFYGDPPSSTGEIAAQLGITVTAVTTRLHRFRAWAREFAVRRLDQLQGVS